MFYFVRGKTVCWKCRPYFLKGKTLDRKTRIWLSKPESPKEKARRIYWREYYEDNYERISIQRSLRYLQKKQQRQQKLLDKVT